MKTVGMSAVNVNTSRARFKKTVVGERNFTLSL
jgi:hypothetical protein